MDDTILVSIVARELLLGPAVGRVARVGRWPGAVPAQVDVGLAAVLHRPSVLGLVHLTNDRTVLVVSTNKDTV